jgi:hypothetical protein
MKFAPELVSTVVGDIDQLINPEFIAQIHHARVLLVEVFKARLTQMRVNIIWASECRHKARSAPCPNVNTANLDPGGAVSKS